MKAFDSCSTKTDFDLLRRSRRVSSRNMWLRVAEDADLVRARVAFAVSSRYGNAVQRNRLRRRLRAALTELARPELTQPGLAQPELGQAESGEPETERLLLPGRYLIGTHGSVQADLRYRTVLDELKLLLQKAQLRVRAGAPTQ